MSEVKNMACFNNLFGNDDGLIWLLLILIVWLGCNNDCGCGGSIGNGNGCGCNG